MPENNEIYVVKALRPGRPAGKYKGKITRKVDYICSDCGLDFSDDVSKGVSKLIMFKTIQKPVKYVRVRTTKFLCIPCMEADLDYQRKALFDSPGMRGTNGSAEEVASPKATDHDGVSGDEHASPQDVQQGIHTSL